MMPSNSDLVGASLGGRHKERYSPHWIDMKSGIRNLMVFFILWCTVTVTTKHCCWPPISMHTMKLEGAQRPTKEIPDDSIGQMTWLFEFNDLLINKRRFPIFGISSSFLITSLFVGTFFYLLDKTEPFQERTIAAVFFMGNFHLCVKNLNFFLKRRQLARLLRLTRQLWGLHLKDFSEEIRRETEDKIIKMTKFMFVSLQFVPLLMILKSCFVNMGAQEEDYKLPFPFVFILDKKDYFITVCVYEAVMLAVAHEIASLHFSFLYFITVQVTAHMRVLCVNLQAHDFNLKAAIAHHAYVIRIVNEVNSLIGGTTMFESICYAVYLATFGYNTIKLVQNMDRIGQLPLNLYLMTIYLLLPYLLCSCGQDITSQSQQIFSSSYQNDWYQLEVKDQKTLMIMMMVARQNLSFSYRGLMTFNMETFAQIINCTYSYLTLLSGMDL